MAQLVYRLSKLHAINLRPADAKNAVRNTCVLGNIF